MAPRIALFVQLKNSWIEPLDTKFNYKATDDKISLRAVTQLLFKDREKVRNLNGAQLTRTSLVLQMQGHLQSFKGSCRNWRRIEYCRTRKYSFASRSRLKCHLAFC